MIFRTIEQFALAFDLFASEHLDPHFDDIKKTAEEWLLEKQSVYCGEVYMEKLERNCYYLFNGVWGIKNAIAQFCCWGAPRFKDLQDLENYCTIVRTCFGRVNNECYFQYLRQGRLINSLDPQCISIIHQLFGDFPVDIEFHLDLVEKLANLRKSGDRKKYIDELEFDCKFWQACLVLSSQCLGYIAMINDFACSTRLLPIKDVIDVINQRLDWRTGFLLGVVQLQLPEELLEMGRVKKNKP